MTIDDQLLIDCRKKVRRAQEAVYRLLYPQAFKVTMRYAKSEADAADILNKAFLKVFMKIDGFQGNGASFWAWTKKIIINQALDYLKQAHFKESFVPIEDHDERLFHDEVRDRDNLNDVIRLIQKLPDTAKCVFNLYVIDGYSHNEIAEELGISTENSRYHLSAARRQLKSWIFKTENI